MPGRVNICTTLAGLPSDLGVAVTVTLGVGTFTMIAAPVESVLSAVALMVVPEK